MSLEQQVRDELSDLDEGDTYQTLVDEKLTNKGGNIQEVQTGESVQSGTLESETEEQAQEEDEEKTSKYPSKIVTQLKASSNKIASYVKETTGAVKAGVAQYDFSMEREAIKSLKISTLDAISNMGQKAADGGSWVWQAGKNAAAATGQRIKRATTRHQTLQSICKQEAVNRPCPRILLCCANALVASGLKEQGLFDESVALEQLEMLFDLFENGSGTAIIPPSTQPHLIAGLLKHFLSNLPEPILTYKYVSELTSSNTPLDRSIFMLSQLPAPNATCVQLLLELFYYVQKNQKSNGMNVGRLAISVSNCLLWKPIQKTPRPTVDNVSETSDDSSINQQKVILSLEESKAFETVLSHWISNYHHIYFNTLDGPISKSNSDAPLSKDNSETSSSKQGD
eukprot:TRINITY_DN8653_c0_g1_i1.p1 TRINITY_DN8653_c0_g1~~TRINITY_DN8653_c0_g1_i1.p1  ORF type:complete len:397 (-),score=48.77 TRINITY_DN8653_c0_g1_i1:382-1572(-)